MNEAETRVELIDPALKAAGWGEVGWPRQRGRDTQCVHRFPTACVSLSGLTYPA
jgi:hypothetical protein